jgi:hypothetical protein
MAGSKRKEKTSSGGETRRTESHIADFISPRGRRPRRRRSNLGGGAFLREPREARSGSSLLAQTLNLSVCDAHGRSLGGFYQQSGRQVGVD